MQPAPWSEDGGEHCANHRIAELNQAVRRHRDRPGRPFEEALAADHTALLHDGLHPNGAGHQRLADRIGERLRR